jgi:general secretion pathway protein G
MTSLLDRLRAHFAALGEERRESAAQRRGEAGFTLIELLVVMVILVLLASLVAPRVISYIGSSKSKTAKVQIESLATSLELYKLDTGDYPNDNDGLLALVARPASAGNWNGPYLKKDSVPADPWGNAYHYRHPGEHAEFDIYSLGKDNQPGGDGENQDVVSWQ